MAIIVARIEKVSTMKTLLSILVLTCASTIVHAQVEVRKKQYNLKKDVAIDGYDPVSYFNGEPTEGDEDIATVYKGIVYHFATPANLAKFKATPDKFEPAYGGWCAYAMGETGEKVKVDPETYKIIEGRVYLFYNFWGNNTLSDWNSRESKLKASADRNWRKFVQ
jgi:YHS domain-containing protein